MAFRLPFPPRLLLFLTTFAAAFALLLVQAAAGPWWKDAGELAAAFSAGSIAHPGGFSANAILAQLLLALPFGSQVFNLGLLSSLATALAAAFLALLVAGPSPRPWALPVAFLAALSLVLTRSVWIHSVAVEVYAPALAFSAFCLWNSAGYFRVAPSGGPGDRDLQEAAFLLGLSLGFHITATMVAGLCFLSLALLPQSPRPSTWRWVSKALALLALGALVVLYLPLRSAAQPPYPFAAVDGLQALLAHLSGSSIRGAFSQRMLELSGPALQENATLYLDQLWRQCGLALPLAWLALLAFGLAARRRGAAGLELPALLGLVWLADGAFSILLNPMGQPEFQTGLLSRFAVFGLAGLGLVALLQRASSQGTALRAWSLGALAVLLALALPLTPAASLPGWQRSPGALQDRAAPEALAVAGSRSPCSNLEGPTLYLEGVWAAPPEALVLSGLDDASALGIFGQVVEGRRPDLFFGVKQFLREPALQRHALASKPESFAPDYLANPDLGAMVSFARSAGRPVLWQRGQESLESARASLPGAPAFPMEWLGVKPDCRLSPDLKHWLLECRPDELGATVLSQDFSLAGLAFLEQCEGQDSDEAARQFARAVEMDRYNCKAWNNLAAWYGRQNQAQPALAMTRRAVQACPRNPSARVNELRYLYLTGNPGEARAKAPLVLEEVSDPGRAAAGLGRLAAQLRRGGFEEEASYLERLLFQP